MKLSALLSTRRVVIGIALILLVGAFAVMRSDDKVRVTAYFPTTLGVYEGSEVRLMGVPIGTVTEVDPEGPQVRVVLEYDGDYELPADATAVIISPSVVADRFVQLTPAYSGKGPTLAKGVVIPIERTRVPVELDTIYSTTNDLLTGLGPQGANNKGALNRLLAVGADNLQGQGAQLRAMLANLSGASSTLGETSPELFAGIGHLERFTGQLAADDEQVRLFNRQMADVSEFLAGERDELSRALGNLAQTFGVVETFVKQNRDLVTSNVDQLTRLSRALVAERDALVGVMKVLPVAASNMARSFDNQKQSIRARANEAQLLNDLGGLLCDALQRQGVPPPTALCQALQSLIQGGQP